MNFYPFYARRLPVALLLACLAQTLLAQSPQLFTRAPAQIKTAVNGELADYGMLLVDAEAYATLVANAPARSWDLALPAVPGLTPALRLRLEPHDLVTDDFRLRTVSGKRPLKNPRLGHHYRGEIVGQPGSRVALSLLDGELTAALTLADGKRLALGRLQTEPAGKQQTTYLLFPDRQVAEQQDFDCATPDAGLPYRAAELAPASAKTTGGCVSVYFEIDHDVYLDKGDATAAAQHLAANFNEVKLLYEDIGVNMVVSEMLVWDTPSPYDGATSGAVLRQFQAERASFNGDLAQLVAYHNRGGIAVLDGLCHPQTAARMSFSGIGTTFAAVPTYSWSTMVIAHEFGHLLGSRHTHACAWNGNGTAIDGCSQTEGTCGRPGVPAEGGTIMSYCHLTAAGINFNVGFGPQPGAVIANRVAAAQDCVNGDCGSGGNPPGDGNDDEDPPADEEPFTCADRPVYLDLLLDNFGMETTWLVTTENGDTLATGGPYPKKQAGRLVRDSVCLTDGCFLLRVNDEDGDGLCCAYGEGSFTLRNETGDTLATGGAFDTLSVTDFCLPFTDDDDDRETPCATVDLTDLPVVSYGGNQDLGIHRITDGGRGIVVQANAWKAVPFAYDVTPATWLSFWFRSTRGGEVHGIGLDDNLVLSANLTMNVYGTQNWGNRTFRDYPGDGQWRFYQIPIGQFYTVEAAYLFFIADHDVGTRDGNSFFRDVTLSEQAPCWPGNVPAASAPGSRETIGLSPNPAADVLHVSLPPDAPRGWNYEVLDLAGKVRWRGVTPGADLDLPVAELPVGAYVLRCTDGVRTASRRFVVAR